MKFPFLLVTFAFLTSSAIAADNLPTSFKYGVSFGECTGYCASEIDVTAQRINFRATSHLQVKPVTPINESDRTTKAEWEEILRLFDKKTFLALPDRNGCPDCADGGAEWVEVTFKPSKAKRVVFGYRHAPAELSDLTKALSKIHSRFKLPNVADSTAVIQPKS